MKYKSIGNYIYELSLLSITVCSKGFILYLMQKKKMEIFSIFYMINSSFQNFKFNYEI